MSQESHLGRASERGSAKHGSELWWTQRVTAVALVPLGIWFVISLLSLPTISYWSVREWMSSGWNAVPLVALILVAAQHSYLGVRVVVEDYVHGAGTRIGTLLVVRFVYIIAAAAGVFAVFEVLFGALP